MHEPDLWKYCTAEHCREMLLSFHLLEGEEWTDEKVISCLYAVSNHTEKHYSRLRIPKKGECGLPYGKNGGIKAGYQRFFWKHHLSSGASQRI